jgi:hypothetical protein
MVNQEKYNLWRKNKYHNDKNFRDKLLNANKDFQKRNPIRFWVYRTIYYHKKKNPILITQYELEQLAYETKECWICGKKLEYNSSKKGFKYNSASLDIKDRKKPAIKKNIQIICNRCNLCKGTNNLKDFIIYCKNVALRN